MIESFDETAEMTIVFELMKGEDLFTRLSRRSYFDESECRHYFQQMLSAVVYIHGEKVAHRDIKPEQFLFSSHKEDAVLKLSDFGFAKRCSEKSRSKIEKSCFRTMCGTPCYASPELLSGNGYGLKTDVWSLGKSSSLISALAALSLDPLILFVLSYRCYPFYNACRVSTIPGRRRRRGKRRRSKD